MIKIDGNIWKGFEEAFRVLEECKIISVPVCGFNYPFFAPGGCYGANWWNIDSCIALSGYRWKDHVFAENALRNFFISQKSDGRVPLYGYDHVQGYDEEISSLPKLFEVAYCMAKESEDIKFVRECYLLIVRYLEWWDNKRFDQETGLYSAVFEETFVPYLSKSRERAAVDTNVEILVGFSCAEALAKRLNEKDSVIKWRNRKKELARSIENWLWNEEKGAYYPLYLKTKKHEDFLMASTFLPLRKKISSSKKAKKLIKLLIGEEFGWNKYPVFSAGCNDPKFTVTEGDYQYNASWSGSVWTLLNEGIVQGLKESGFLELAAELIYKTIREFDCNYSEFLHPFNGSGQGVKRYAWTAAQYIRLVLEEMIGIEVDAERKKVRVRPLLYGELLKKEISISKISLPDGGIMDITIRNGRVSSCTVVNSLYSVV